MAMAKTTAASSSSTPSSMESTSKHSAESLPTPAADKEELPHESRNRQAGTNATGNRSAQNQATPTLLSQRQMERRRLREQQMDNSPNTGEPQEGEHQQHSPSKRQAPLHSLVSSSLLPIPSNKPAGAGYSKHLQKFFVKVPAVDEAANAQPDTNADADAEPNPHSNMGASNQRRSQQQQLDDDNDGDIARQKQPQPQLQQHPTTPKPSSSSERKRSSSRGRIRPTTPKSGKPTSKNRRRRSSPPNKRPTKQRSETSEAGSGSGSGSGSRPKDIRKSKTKDKPRSKRRSGSASKTSDHRSSTRRSQNSQRESDAAASSSTLVASDHNSGSDGHSFHMESDHVASQSSDNELEFHDDFEDGIETHGSSDGSAGRAETPTSERHVKDSEHNKTKRSAKPRSKKSLINKDKQKDKYKSKSRSSKSKDPDQDKNQQPIKSSSVRNGDVGKGISRTKQTHGRTKSLGAALNLGHVLSPGVLSKASLDMTLATTDETISASTYGSFQGTPDDKQQQQKSQLEKELEELLVKSAADSAAAVMSKLTEPHRSRSTERRPRSGSQAPRRRHRSRGRPNGRSGDNHSRSPSAHRQSIGRSRSRGRLPRDSAKQDGSTSPGANRRLEKRGSFSSMKDVAKSLSERAKSPHSMGRRRRVQSSSTSNGRSRSSGKSPGRYGSRTLSSRRRSDTPEDTVSSRRERKTRQVSSTSAAPETNCDDAALPEMPPPLGTFEMLAPPSSSSRRKSSDGTKSTSRSSSDAKARKRSPKLTPSSSANRKLRKSKRGSADEARSPNSARVAGSVLAELHPSRSADNGNSVDNEREDSSGYDINGGINDADDDEFDELAPIRPSSTKTSLKPQDSSSVRKIKYIPSSRKSTPSRTKSAPIKAARLNKSASSLSSSNHRDTASAGDAEVDEVDVSAEPPASPRSMDLRKRFQDDFPDEPVPSDIILRQLYKDEPPPIAKGAASVPAPVPAAQQVTLSIPQISKHMMNRQDSSSDLSFATEATWEGYGKQKKKSPEKAPSLYLENGVIQEEGDGNNNDDMFGESMQQSRPSFLEHNLKRLSGELSTELGSSFAFHSSTAQVAKPDGQFDDETAEESGVTETENVLEMDVNNNCKVKFDHMRGPVSVPASNKLTFHQSTGSMERNNLRFPTKWNDRAFHNSTGTFFSQQSSTSSNTPNLTTANSRHTERSSRSIPISMDIDDLSKSEHRPTTKFKPKAKVIIDSEWETSLSPTVEQDQELEHEHVQTKQTPTLVEDPTTDADATNEQSMDWFSSSFLNPKQRQAGQRGRDGDNPIDNHQSMPIKTQQGSQLLPAGAGFNVAASMTNVITPSNFTNSSNHSGNGDLFKSGQDMLKGSRHSMDGDESLSVMDLELDPFEEDESGSHETNEEEQKSKRQNRFEASFSSFESASVSIHGDSYSDAKHGDSGVKMQLEKNSQSILLDKAVPTMKIGLAKAIAPAVSATAALAVATGASSNSSSNNNNSTSKANRSAFGGFTNFRAPDKAFTARNNRSLPGRSKSDIGAFMGSGTLKTMQISLTKSRNIRSETKTNDSLGTQSQHQRKQQQRNDENQSRIKRSHSSEDFLSTPFAASIGAKHASDGGGNRNGNANGNDDGQFFTVESIQSLAFASNGEEDPMDQFLKTCTTTRAPALARSKTDEKYHRRAHSRERVRDRSRARTDRETDRNKSRDRARQSRFAALDTASDIAAGPKNQLGDWMGSNENEDIGDAIGNEGVIEVGSTDMLSPLTTATRKMVPATARRRLRVARAS